MRGGGRSAEASITISNCRVPREPLERTSWGSAACLLVAAVYMWLAEKPLPGGSESRSKVEPPGAAQLDTNDLDAAVEEVIMRNPFRLSRRPSGVPFGSEAQLIPQPAPAAPPRPRLVLAGLVGGPPWVALLEGIPGRDGPVAVRQGDTLAGLSIRDVTRDGAVIADLDTLWRLTLKRIAP